MKQLKAVDLPRRIGNLEVLFLMWLRNGCINTVKLNYFPPSTLTVSHRPYVWESALIWKKKIFCMIKNINSLTKNIQLFFLEYGPQNIQLFFLEYGPSRKNLQSLTLWSSEFCSRTLSNFSVFFLVDQRQ